MGKVLVGFIIAIVLGFAAFTWLTLHWSYSDGERAGLLQKFSRKGWVCKTWEGEMALVTPAAVAAEKFLFTVRDEEIAKELTADIGQRVTVHYEQRKWIPTSCFGDTEYFITTVKVTPPTQPLTPQ
jgi:lysophospholipid acyltransferase (LPLAT)-like uncharacterized protein